MTGSALIGTASAFADPMFLDIPFADQLLCGGVYGRTPRDTKRGLLPDTAPQGFEASAFDGNPVVFDAFISCNYGAGLRLPVNMPATWTAVALVFNVLRPVGFVQPVISNLGPIVSPPFVAGDALAFGGAAGQYSICAWYQNSTDGVAQGAHVSVEAIDDTRPTFIAATVDGTHSRAYAGVGGALLTSAAPLVNRSASAWGSKPTYVGKDARALGQEAVDNAFFPNIVLGALYEALDDSQVGQLRAWAQEWSPAYCGLPLN